MNGYNFTDRVRKVLQMAREEAARLHHEYVGTEHILLGLIREGEGVAAAVLTNLSVDLDDIQQKIEETVKKGKAAAAAGPDLPYTSRAKKVLELAMSEARELGHSYVGTEHLLLGLLREEKGIAAQVLGSGPDSPWESIHRLHVGAIHAASRRVWLATPYFVPGEAALMALTSAALGGLDVRVLVPRTSDSRLVTWAARSYFDELMAAGVRVYEYGPRMLHTKALLVDDDLAIVGSANFDPRSFRLNFEVSVLFRDAAIAGELSQLYERELALAPRVRADRDRPLWSVRLPEALARLLSPLL